MLNHMSKVPGSALPPPLGAFFFWGGGGFQPDLKVQWYQLHLLIVYRKFFLIKVQELVVKNLSLLVNQRKIVLQAVVLSAVYQNCYPGFPTFPRFGNCQAGQADHSQHLLEPGKKQVQIFFQGLKFENKFEVEVQLLLL